MVLQMKKYFLLILPLISIIVSAEKPNFSNMPTSIDVQENEEYVLTVEASDPDGTSIAYSLVTSYRDSTLFTIGAVNGILKFKNGKDYENPTDANSDNTYEVKIRARDGNNERNTTVLSVNITNYDDESPRITNHQTSQNVKENHLFVKDYNATDPDSDSLTWSLAPSFKQNSYFTINSSNGKLYFKDIPDWENPASGSNQLKVQIRVSDGTNQTQRNVTVNVKNAIERTVNVSILPATHIILDGSTPQNLMYDHEYSSEIGNYTGEPISYDMKNLNKDLAFGSYPYTLVAGFVGYWEDTVDTSGFSMSNDYDDYLVDTSSSDDTLFIRLQQPKGNPDCGENDFNGNQPLCSLTLQIYRYDATYNSYSLWRQIVSGTKNKTIRLPKRNFSYMIRVAASSEMTSNQGNSQYYLYAYRAGNTPGNVLNAFSMANNDSSDNAYNWYQSDIDASNDEEWEYSENRILVYNKNDRKRESLLKKENFSQISDLAEDILLKKDGFSVIELNPNQMSMFSAPANNIISNQDDLSNYDSINGEQPKSPLIKTAESDLDSIENIVSVLSKLYIDNEFSLDYKVKTHGFNYDPAYIRYQKEYFDMINAEQGLNNIGTGDRVADVVVAVIDTGSPSKGSRAWNSSEWVEGEYDFVSGDFDATDPSATMEYPNNGSHGTHVATTIAAKNDGKNINGFGLKVLPLRALDENGSGSYSWICNAIAYAGQIENDTGEIAPRKADVINMSLGGGGSCPCQSVIDEVYRNGVVIVASAGNGYVDANNYPASCDNVLSVSSIGSNGQKAYYSNYGEKVDISAPGGDAYLDVDDDGDWDGIWAFTKDNKLQLYQGTSMAAPIASAAIGNVIAKYKNASPQHIDNLIKKRVILQDKGDEGFDRVFGYGLVDFEKVSLNSKLPPRDLRTTASIAVSVVNLSTNSSGSIKIKKAGIGNNISVSRAYSSHPGISITAFDVDNKGFGTYEILIDESEFNGNVGRFQESISFDVTDSFGTDVISRPIIFQIGNISDARDPSNLARMYFLAEISSSANKNELDQNIYSERFRVEGNSGFTFGIEDAHYNTIVSTDSDNDYYLCDFGEIYWSELNNVTANFDKEVVIDGNTELRISGQTGFKSDYKGTRRDR